ncbi:peptidase T [Vagococcus elongatus]|uniref:Peptidase T n=1 Tax=Vagococcus elongatus TaxID=180344 RepID=A0A430B277_9ENTE|nr:peptidase T [Vagococcus elongatus]RSU14399.1 peptidase T [Vagococcus elongatus]
MLERFIRYVKINTRSDAKSQTVPSTASQVAFAKMLAEDLKQLGLSEVEYLEKNGFVVATLPSNLSKSIPTIGFIAHIDTADYRAENISPQVHENYDGRDILLNEAEGLSLTVSDFPQLKNYKGQTLITTDGTTLLGADDKAGIVEILAAMEYFLSHPEVPHGEIRLAFGPDEEIGRGADLFDAPHFRAAYAYTVDSGTVGRFEYATFNASQATITIEGISVHPGTAKDSMVHAGRLATEFDRSLPSEEVPEKTEGYEGFYMLAHISGSVDSATLVYIIRDHDRSKFQERKEVIEKLVSSFNQRFDRPRLRLEFSDQYYNMGEIIEKNPYPVTLAKKAMNNLGIEPIIEPFRGGTDGSKISFMGIPTPNLFTGGENFHGQFEFISLQSMEAARDTIIEIICEHSENG